MSTERFEIEIDIPEVVETATEVTVTCGSSVLVVSGRGLYPGLWGVNKPDSFAPAATEKYDSPESALAAAAVLVRMVERRKLVEAAVRAAMKGDGNGRDQDI